MKNVNPTFETNIGPGPKNYSYGTVEKNNTVLQVINWLLILLWFYTALDKLIFYSAYKLTMQGQIFPQPWLQYMIPAIPIIELIAGMLLLKSALRIFGLILSLILMAFFTVYVALVVYGFFPAKPCACAGLFRNLNWNTHLVINIFFLLVALLGIIVYRFRRKEAKE